MDFIETPRKKYNIVPNKGGKREKKMSKKDETAPAVKPRKVYQKTRSEHFKDIAIAVLITGILAFAAGVWYNDQQAAELDAAVNEATAAQAAPAPVKK